MSLYYFLVFHIHRRLLDSLSINKIPSRRSPSNKFPIITQCTSTNLKWPPLSLTYYPYLKQTNSHSCPPGPSPTALDNHQLDKVSYHWKQCRPLIGFIWLPLVLCCPSEVRCSTPTSRGHNPPETINCVESCRAYSLSPLITPPCHLLRRIVCWSSIPILPSSSTCGKCFWWAAAATAAS